MAERREESKVQMLCEQCGSAQITRDAWAEWSLDEQDWQLGAVFDYAFCHLCGKSTHIEEKSL